MKKLLSLFLSLVICTLILSVITIGVSAANEVSVFDGTSVNKIATGSGTEADPFIITKAAELDYVATACMSGDTFAGKYIKLGVNINWGGRVWTPIGYTTTTVFSGNFDGNGKTIFNLTCTDTAVGIFAYATGAVIKNLNIDYATFTTNTRYAGAIVALMRDSDISGCSGGANVKIMTTDSMANTAQIGGLFGLVNNSTVKNCTFNGEVIVTSITGVSFIGGIAGVVGNNSEISFCVNNGIVRVTTPSTTGTSYAYAGGVVGGIGSSSVVGTIKNCINTGEVIAIEYAGGILGRVHVKDSTMNDCYNVGMVSSTTAGFAAAIIGEIPSTAILSGSYGVSSATAPAAYAKGDAAAIDPNALKLATESEIMALDGYKKIITSIETNLPVFDKIDPDAATKSPVTQPPATEPTAVTTAVTTEPPANTAETTAGSAESTTAPPAAATTAEPVKSGGCASAFAGGAIIITVIFAGVVIFKRRG